MIVIILHQHRVNTRAAVVFSDHILHEWQHKVTITTNHFMNTVFSSLTCPESRTEPTISETQKVEGTFLSGVESCSDFGVLVLSLLSPHFPIRSTDGNLFPLLILFLC